MDSITKTTHRTGRLWIPTHEILLCDPKNIPGSVLDDYKRWIEKEVSTKGYATTRSLNLMTWKEKSARPKKGYLPRVKDQVGYPPRYGIREIGKREEV